jgi:hypothetical protein
MLRGRGGGPGPRARRDARPRPGGALRRPAGADGRRRHRRRGRPEAMLQRLGRCSGSTARGAGGRSVAGRRIGDHRREFASAASLPSTSALPANLHTLARFWTNSTSSGAARRARPGAELRALDRHEIDQLAAAGEAERFDREHARGLRQRLDDQHAGHDRPAREMALEEALVDRHRLDRDDRTSGSSARPGRPAASDSDAAAPPSPAGYRAGRWRR